VGEHLIEDRTAGRRGVRRFVAGGAVVLRRVGLGFGRDVVAFGAGLDVGVAGLGDASASSRSWSAPGSSVASVATSGVSAEARFVASGLCRSSPTAAKPTPMTTAVAPATNVNRAR
jgi:hypothetical protein